MTTQDESLPYDLGRRRLFQAIGAAGVATALPMLPAQAQQREAPAQAYIFFNAAEATFIEAAVARLIPKDATGPGALEAGVPNYIDKQLAGAWGAGERLYRSGPWQPGAPTQGYQLPFTPAELFRNAIRALNQKHAGFATLMPKEQDAFLDALQKSKEDLGGVPSNVFFESLLEVTIEGFFADPVYGGNKDMTPWKMIGFPGAYADFYEYVDKYNIAYTAPPTSLAQDANGRIHIHIEPKRK
ncbi:MAG TPA: gluconate 2-dehydrogenase subunit 3 family protein [Burkholderiales bacterium]|nr:gluconate 2-dehydrogenase subunit 3 family protein [Burkholderiales bacterium]